MKVTPLEIRQKAFEKKLRGYDKDEVNAYMQSLSQEWERLIEENKDLKIRLENAEKDVQRLREVEASLFKTLKTAEDTGANMIDQANKAADLQVKQATMQAEAMLNDAKNQARNLIEEAESKVRERLENAKDQLRLLEADCKLIDNHRDNLLIELRGVANDTIDRVSKLQNKQSQIPQLDGKELDLDSGAISFDDLQSGTELKREEPTVSTPDPVIEEEPITPESEVTPIATPDEDLQEPLEEYDQGDQVDEVPEEEVQYNDPSPAEEIVFEIENSNKVIDEETVSQINEEVSKSNNDVVEPEITETEVDKVEPNVAESEVSETEQPKEESPEKKEEGTGSFFDSI